MSKAIWLVIACLATACHIVDVRETKHYKYQSHTISKEVWHAIDVGVTDRQWLLQHLGPPSAITNSAGQQIYTYRYEELFNKHKSVFLLYQKQKIDVTQKVHSVILKDGVVVAHSDITAVPISVLSAKEVSGEVPSNGGLPSTTPDNAGVSMLGSADDSETEVEGAATPAAVVMPAPLDREL